LQIPLDCPALFQRVRCNFIKTVESHILLRFITLTHQ
jgi:hypothetical protein